MWSDDGRKVGEVGSEIPLDPPLSNVRVSVRVWMGIANSASKKLVGSSVIPMEETQVHKLEKSQ